jgi:EpsD family peptidyl-prolyl cis-trans isomerase
MRLPIQLPLALQRTLLSTSVAALLLVSLSACGNKDEAKAATQVAAKVGSEEISVHQINQVLSRTNTGGASPEAVQNLSREVLEKLIDQQLAVDAATEAKLHRSPDVVTQIEAAKREILARAFLQSITATLPKPSAEDAKKYFTEHPQLFSERRIFNLQELVAPTGAAMATQVRSLTTAGKSMEDIAALLKDKSVPFSGGAVTRAAEQIPLETLPKIHALKDGQFAVQENGPALSVVRVMSSQASPVTEAAALPRIEQFLANQRANEAVSAKIKSLRADTKVSYMGNFAAPTAATASTEATPSNASNQPAAPAAPAQSAIEKGVAGLK